MPTESDAAPPTRKPVLAVFLRARRQRALLTQEQLAQRTGLSVRTISRLEAGSLRPRSESLRLLADALGLNQADRALLAAAAHGQPVLPETPSAASPIPHQLPADVAGFTGRAKHLAELDGLLAGDGTATAVVISAIAGTAGVGKTALAVHWAHRVGERFPDGQLYVNLRGYASGPPVSSIEALALLLHGLGVEADKIPVEGEKAAALYRSLLADRRVLVVLDNARDAEQVRPLLPGGPGCLVVVTSRERLGGLVASHGAQRLVLDVLPPEEAIELLARLLGAERVGVEPAATAELAGLCGNLPLALRIAAANLVGQPDQPISGYVARLGAGDRLAGLEVEGDPHAAVRAAFACSYVVLDSHAQRMFRLLGLAPGADVSVPAAAALAQIAPEQAARLLERLGAGHLLEVRSPGRYSFHDLLRQYARERAEQEDDQPGREAAVGRLLDWYLRTADAAARLLHPHLMRLPMPAARDGLPPAEFDENAGALGWLDAEQTNLAAVVAHAAEHGPKQLAWLLTDTLRGYATLRRHTIDWLAVAHVGLAAAAERGDVRAQAAAHHTLGQAHVDLGHYPQATGHHTAALELARQAGWIDGQAAILSSLGNAHWYMGSLRDAADTYAQALALCRQTGQVGGQAIALGNLANIERELGRLDEAHKHLTRALALFREVGSRVGEAHILVNLGEVHHDLGLLDHAHEHLTRALALFREAGSRLGEAHVLVNLAEVHHDAGRSLEALEIARAAVTLAREVGDLRAEAEALGRLGGVELWLGRRRDAVQHLRQVLELARRIGSRYTEASALAGLAAAQQRQGDNAHAIDHATQALALAGKAGYRILEGRAHTVLATAHLALDDRERAVEHARRALALHRATGHRLGQARALLVLGHIQRQTQDGGDVAAARWREALALFTDIGAPEADQTKALLDTP